jgi:CheY-like chemotaxis protein/HPt (histidine-containing phosphotransfer) domain-containing protein
LISSSIRCEAPHRVLLVDDDSVSLELMSLLLAHEGHQVLRANDAGAALDLLASENGGRPDVLLVDLQMPGISGGQLAERIRAMKGPEPLLLAMSATGAQQQQLLAFDGFLLKPLALGDLRRALQPGRRPALPSKKPSHKPVVRTGHKTRTVSRDAVDMAVVSKLLGMMRAESLHDVVAACIADSRACVEAIQRQVQSGDGDGVSPLAHRIKGAASMIGASRLAGLAANLELGGGKEAATPGVLANLLSACGELESMLFAGKFTKTQGPPP